MNHEQALLHVTSLSEQYAVRNLINALHGRLQMQSRDETSAPEEVA